MNVQRVVRWSVAEVTEAHAMQRGELTGCPWHDVKAMLRSVGLRPTRQRMALGWLLFGKGDRHLSAEMLYEEASRAKVPVSLATIYNTLLSARRCVKRQNNHVSCLTSSPGSPASPVKVCHTRLEFFAVSQPPSTSTAPIPANVTPAMRQYLDAKRQYRDALVFFRMGDFYEMFYEDALVAARALDLTLTSRSKDASGTAVPMCGVPLPRRRRLHRAAGEEGLPRRHLRAGRGPEEGQGRGQARGGARRLARHADRRRLPRGARAGVPDGDCRDRAARPDRRLRRGAGRPLHRRVRRRRVHAGADGLAGAARRDRRAAPARDRRRRRATTSRGAARDRAARRSPVTASTAGTSSSRSRAADAARSAARAAASRASASSAARPRCAPAARWSATCATRRRPTSRTSARVRLRQPADGLLDRSDHAQAPRGRRGDATAAAADRCSTRSIARSRRWAAGCCARGCCARCGARADPRPPRRRRGARVRDRPSAASCARR